MFQFGDAERRLEPGIFRARAMRAFYADWKGGGQVNFLKPFSAIWAERWKIVSKPQPIEVYARLGIDYVVFRSAHRQPGRTPAFQNGSWVVYDLRKDVDFRSRRNGCLRAQPCDGKSRRRIRESKSFRQRKILLSARLPAPR